jgi:hypothetical protein
MDTNKIYIKLKKHVGKTCILDFATGNLRKRKNFFLIRQIAKLEDCGEDGFAVGYANFDAHAIGKIEMLGVVPKIQIKDQTSEAYGLGVTTGKMEALKYTPEERERYGKWSGGKLP